MEKEAPNVTERCFVAMSKVFLGNVIRDAVTCTEHTCHKTVTALMLSMRKSSMGVLCKTLAVELRD